MIQIIISSMPIDFQKSIPVSISDFNISMYIPYGDYILKHISIHKNATSSNINMEIHVYKPYNFAKVGCINLKLCRL